MLCRLLSAYSGARVQERSASPRSDGKRVFHKQQGFDKKVSNAKTLREFVFL
jgi:hypothetical protein